MKRLPIPTKYDAGMIRSETVGRARMYAVGLVPCSLLYRASVKTLGSLPPSGRPIPAGVPSLAAGPGELCARRADPDCLLRGTKLNRTYGTHEKLYILLFLLIIYGPIYYGPP